ncbi:MAG TPA: YihY/virulence factor BrkB family protein [Candidatus Omnitrophota bacterium]|nr:YihY/virulence factor BrkB family protein [Candidatus Omnitrophota bacterium]
MSYVRHLIQFLKVDIWRIRMHKLPPTKSLLLKQLRIMLLAFRGFDEDKCQLRASALTFYSLLSIVPFVAMAFGIAKGFGIEKILEKQLYEKLAGQEEVVGKIINFSQTLLETTKGGVIAGVGVAILFWTVIKVLGNIESSFNDIWGIRKSRTWGRKFSDYLSIMLICPLLLIMSSSVTVLVTSQVKLVVDKIAFLGVFSPVIFTVLNLLPYCVIWVLFTYIYIFMPNTSVSFKSGLFGGMIGGTIYQITQWIYITFQVGAAKYGAVYGSFAALPLFLVWLQTSWIIVLFGAEISFAEQNVETYELEPDCLKASHAFKRLLSLRIVQMAVKRFCLSQTPYTAADIVKEIEIPIRLLRQILFDLTEAGILVEVRLEDGRQIGYQPAFNVETLSVAKVNELLDDKGISEMPIIRSGEMEHIERCLRSFRVLAEQSPENILLKNM